MKIFIVSNLYPPHYLGGYEVRCKQVAEALAAAGHDVHVLTSTFGLSRQQPDGAAEREHGVAIHRLLGQYAYGAQSTRRPWTYWQARRELRDARHFTDLLRRVRPDVVNWWSMNGLSKTLIPIPSRLGIPDVHWIEHWWILDEYGADGSKAAAFWMNFFHGRWGPNVAAPLTRAIGRRWESAMRRDGLPTRSFPNHPTHACFVSEFLRTMHREHGVEFASSEVIHGGVPATLFSAGGRERRRPGEPLRLLYVGQLSPDRGAHTIIEALGFMTPAERARVALTVVGAGPAEYEARLHAAASQPDLRGRVTFRGKLSHASVPDVYRAHDVLVFPSTRAEGLPLTMVEAMLSGCAVVTTGSGGAIEIASAARLPLFPKDDPRALARLLADLATDTSSVEQIAARGRAVASTTFAFETMMSRIDAMLRLVVVRTPAVLASGATGGADGRVG